MKSQNKPALLVDDEAIWIEQIESEFKKLGNRQVKTFNSYTQAEKELQKLKLSDCSCAIIDVHLRKQLFDQSGLALLDTIKRREPNFPVLILTSYSYNYPGLNKITSRYRNVMTYDKEVFVKSPKVILNALLQTLPPQIGESEDGPKQTTIEEPAQTIKSESSSGNNSIILGFICIILILGAGIGCFFIFDRFSSYSRQGNIIFALVVICLMAVLISVFGNNTIGSAIRYTKGWFKYFTKK